MSSSDEEVKCSKEVKAAFFQAAAEGDIDGLKSGLQAGASTELDSRDAEGFTPLMHAAKAGKADAVELLLAKGAKPNLHSCVMERRRIGHGEVVSRVEMQMGYTLKQGGAKLTALHLAVFSRSAATVDALLKAPNLNVNLQADSDEGNSLSPLHIAVALGCEALVKSLLAAPGIDVNVATTSTALQLCTALDLARAPARRVEAFDAMGYRDQDFLADLKAEETELAYRFEDTFQPGPPYPSLVALIEEAGGKTGADINDERSEPSEECMQNAREYITKKGISATELFVEAQGLNQKLAAIKLGADVNAAGKMPPLIRAMYWTSRTLARALVEANADVNITNENGDTPLHMAAKLGNDIETVEYLIGKKADVNAKGLDGKTPLDCVIMYQGVVWKDCVNMLQAAGGVSGSSTSGTGGYK